MIAERIRRMARLGLDVTGWRRAGLTLFAAMALLAVAPAPHAQEAAPGHEAVPAPGQEAAPAHEPTALGDIEQAEEALEAGHPVPAAEGEHGGAGMPQLRTETYLSQIFWLIVTFGILYWLLSTRALPRIAEVLGARQDRIAADLDRAAELRNEAEQALARYEEVLAEAHARAQARLREVDERLAADAAERQAALDRELAQKLQAAEARIAAAREQALEQIREVAVEVAQVAAARVAGLEVSPDATRAALDRVMAEAA
jgi:F-type H+-transporting ATPase subunit b